MFSEARLKLTAWYLLIIMVISVLFSVAFYNLSTREINRILRLQEERQEIRSLFVLPSPKDNIIFTSRGVSTQDIDEALQRLRIILVLINGIIFVVAGGAAYFLAGRTLTPIAEMIDSQNRFISDASHEMRTPLTSLRSEIEVALRDKNLEGAQYKKILQSNLEEVINLQSLSNNMLELSQKGKLQQDFNPSKFALKISVESALKRLNGLITDKQIVINQKVPNIFIDAVPERITELFVILLDNAIKYSPKKSTVSISARKINRTVHIEIKDQGVGIPKEDLPHVFDRFYRSDKSRTAIGGYGLGLSIAKEIVDSHGGTIVIKSAVSKGTTVIIDL